MAETSAPPFDADAWLDAGRKYWDAWQGLWQQGVEAGARASEPSAKAAPGPTDPIQALMDQATLFVRLGEELAASMRRSGGVLDTDQWRQVFQDTAWKLPFDTWSRTFSSTSLFPGDFLERFKPEAWTAVADDMHRNLERFLSVPGLGYTREWQEQGQEFARLGLDYQRALQEYAALFRRLNVEAFDRLQKKLHHLADVGKPVTTLRGLYDAWVDASEAAYLDLAATDEYAETYGRLVNALMALKRQGRTMVDETAGAMGMPTRQGFNTLQRRHQELRREVASMRAQLAEAKAGLAQVAKLRNEVEQLRGKGATRGRRNRPKAKGS
jgi:class III poly(R)-hydroxyalkanoic acid synthase PhaE subunit